MQYSEAMNRLKSNQRWRIVETIGPIRRM